jgi:hypothetical protein
MPQNATPTEELTPAQDQALAALLGGKCVTEAATIAGVDRVTVHRWLKDWSFKAAFNRRRRELQEAMEARLMALANKAADCVDQSLATGDAKTGLALLKGLGLLTGRRPNIPVFDVDGDVDWDDEDFDDFEDDDR